MGPNYRAGLRGGCTLASLIPICRLARARLCVPAQALFLLQLCGWGLPCRTAWGVPRTGSIWAKQWAQASRWPCAAKSTGAGHACLWPVGVCPAPGCQPLSHSAKRLGGSSPINTPTGRSFLQAESIQLENTQQERAPLPVATACMKTREPTEEVISRCL